MSPYPQTGWVGSSLASPHNPDLPIQIPSHIPPNHFLFWFSLTLPTYLLLLLFLFKERKEKEKKGGLNLKLRRNMVRSNVPKFGNWDTEENVPYTTYFENPRRVSSSEKDGKRTETARMKHEREVSLEDGELRRPFDSPSYNNGGNRASGDSTPQRPAVVSSDAPKRAARLNGAGFRSADHSPLHPHYQAKISSKASVVSSPSWERKGSSEGTHGLAPSTPGRSRLRSVPRGSETPDRGASVPKFGEWDETDPSSADGYSMIFNKVKEERHGSGGNASGTATDAQRSSGQKHYRSNNSKRCCCFPWGGN